MVSKLFMLFALLFVAIRGEPVQLSMDNFDSMIKGVPVFVKFYSPNCPHCQRLVPVWEKVDESAPSHPQGFHVADVDCTSETLLCERFGIRGVPTLLFFKDGMMYKFAGRREYNDIMKFGAGDFVNAKESAEIPAPGGYGVVSQARYTVLKFLKDLVAIVQFNLWAVLFMVGTGFLSGCLITFTYMVSVLDRQRTRVDALAAAATEEEEVPEKLPEEKKTD